MTFVFIRKNVIAGAIALVKDLTVGKRYHWKRDRSIYGIVRQAPENGCCLFDTASAYGQSERVLGQALKKYKREDLFIVTKLSNVEQRAGNVERALQRSLKRLQVDAVDLYLMHWPQTGTYIDCWRQMEEIYEKRLARAIGVCNFKKHHFDELRKTAKIMPMVCQIESHPLFPQNDMLEYCKENHIVMMAYTPTGRMDKRLTQSPVLTELAKKKQASVVQIIIRWHYQRGCVPIINTTSSKHLKENMEIYGFSLDESEMKAIDGLDIHCRLRYDPDTVDFMKC